MATQATKTELKSGKPIDVDVWAWIDKPTGEVKFDHIWDLRGNPKNKKGTIDIPPGQPSTEIKFTLIEDKTGLDLEFYSDPDDAMWVDLAPNCPNQPGGGGQITFQSSSKKVLRVDDANAGQPCDLKYALRFYGMSKTIDGRDYKPPYEYDPDLKNGGGGNTGVGFFNVPGGILTVAAVGIALVAIAALLWDN